MYLVSVQSEIPILVVSHEPGKVHTYLSKSHHIWQMTRKEYNQQSSLEDFGMHMICVVSGMENSQNTIS